MRNLKGGQARRGQLDVRIGRETQLGTPPSAPAEPTSTLACLDWRLLFNRTPERLVRPVPPVDTRLGEPTLSEGVAPFKAVLAGDEDCALTDPFASSA